MARNDYKESVRAASVENIDLTSPGTSIDGVVMRSSDRFLVKNQNNARENGIYVWLGPNVPARRATDADRSGEVTSGFQVPVEEGAVNGNKVFFLVTDDPIALGETPLSFARLGPGGSTTSPTPAFDPSEPQTITAPWNFEAGVTLPFGQFIAADITGTMLKTFGGTLQLEPSGNPAMRMLSSGDSNYRFFMDGAAAISWGSGSQPLDVTLQRAGSGHLSVTGKLSQTGTPSDPDDLITVQYLADNAPGGGGGVAVGDNNTWTGENTFRNTVMIDGDNGGWLLHKNIDVQVENSNPGSGAYMSYVTGESNNRWAMSSAGKMLWSSGTSSYDVTLERLDGTLVASNDDSVAALAVRTTGDLFNGVNIWGNGFEIGDGSVDPSGQG